MKRDNIALDLEYMDDTLSSGPPDLAELEVIGYFDYITHVITQVSYFHCQQPYMVFHKKRTAYICP